MDIPLEVKKGMTVKIEVATKSYLPDAASAGLQQDIEDLGIGKVEQVKIVQVYRLQGELLEEEALRICRELLADSITQDYSYDGPLIATAENAYTLEVAYNPGVMDPVEATVIKAVRDLGIEGVESVKTARKYVVWGKLTADELQTICDRLLVNRTIQHLVAEGESIALPSAEYDFKLVQVDLLNADDAELMRLSEGRLWLNLAEMQLIQEYFRRLGRNPTDAELETIAQTWSEHCVHKTFKGRIRYNGRVIDNLLKSTIMKVTEELNKPWCLSVFRDNAGVIEFDDEHALCFKVETHNHPSALEPYGGASTGIGGVIRDPLGTGVGAKPILNTDVFCFGPPDLPYERLPKGVLHPKRIF